MRMYDLILKKKQGGELSTDEIRYMIEGFTEGSIPDYQMSAMTMAICFRGMTPRETVDLTLAMRDSGDVLDLSGIKGVKVDKHSTGGGRQDLTGADTDHCCARGSGCENVRQGTGAYRRNNRQVRMF